MTPRILCFALALTSVLLIAPQTARAQNFGGQYMGSSDNPVGPTVSPYLNLTQSNPTVTNYQSLVRPLIDQGNSIRRQGNSISSLQRQAYGGGGGSRGTGHATYYMNYGHYYPSAR